jgi:ribosome-associated translation inhibitor RaiA
MQVPVQVTFRDLPLSDAVEAACREEAAGLERLFDHLTSCRVVIARIGRRAGVHLDLTMPGFEITVNRETKNQGADEDIFAAIAEAFEHARRQLREHVKRLQSQR